MTVVNATKSSVQTKISPYIKRPTAPKKSIKTLMSTFGLSGLNPEKEFHYDFSKEKFIQFNIPVRNAKDVAKVTGLREKFIKKLIQHEGYKTESYNDIAGYKTNGIGHKNGTVSLNKEEVYQQFAKDVKEHSKYVDILTSGRKLKSYQRETLIDLTFNVGPTKLAQSKLIKYIKEGHPEKACNEFDYIKAGGKASSGLCLRRLENISDFYANDINQNEVGAMKNLQQKMYVAYNKRLKQTKDKAKKLKILDEKAFFTRRSNELIASAAGRIKTKSPTEKDLNYAQHKALPNNGFYLLAQNR